jgi:hypothetical protein
MFGAPSLVGAEPWKVEKGNVFSPLMFDVEDCTTKRVFAFDHNLNTKSKNKNHLNFKDLGVMTWNVKKFL